MNDREIFKDNLNYFLAKSGKKQKDLAKYVGAKTTTVSGWTRGISYPRADSMEKIAMFFGISTSRLVGNKEDTSSPVIIPNTDVFRKIMMSLSVTDYQIVMDIFSRAEAKLREKGEL